MTVKVDFNDILNVLLHMDHNIIGYYVTLYPT